MHSNESVEAQLIDRLRRNEPEGLAAAYDRYGGVAYSLFLRITRNQSISEDLVQELFLRVWNRRHVFDAAKGSLGAWVTSIARNIAIDYVRSAHAHFQTKLRPIDQTDSLLFSYRRQEPEKTLDAVCRIRDSLQSLSDNQRRALELAYFEGCSQTEIALRMQEPLGTVKSWIRSALNRLRVEARREVANRIMPASMTRSMCTRSARRCKKQKPTHRDRPGPAGQVCCPDRDTPQSTWPRVPVSQ